MRLHRDSREYLYLDVTVDTDPATATLEVSIDGGAWAVWDWTGAATTSAGKWTRTGRKLFAGPSADPGSATVLALGRHQVRWRLAGLSVEVPARPASDAVDVA